MTPEPRRWLDDPSALSGTGCDLGAEATTLEAPDLVALRARVLASTAAPPPAGARWPRGALRWVTVSAVVAMWLVWPGTSPSPSVSVDAAVTAQTELPVAPITARDVDEAPPGQPPAAPITPSALAELGGVRLSRLPPTTTPRVAPRSQARGEDLAARVENAPPSALPTLRVDVSPGPSSGSRSGDLAEQLAAFADAESILAEGDIARATAGYHAYLARWPAGHFAQEAGLGLLRAAVAAGDHAEAARLAAALMDAPELLPQRTTLLTVRVEALSRLGRCAEAVPLSAELDRAMRRRVRRMCR